MKRKVEVVTKTKHWCNFCGKSQDEVSQMIAGPDDADICNECVMACHELVFDAQSKASSEDSQ
ncbi:ClpX C4-type zinc finger protein [Caballeronia sp. LZ035]|uniref:ClpX C4-type zinc finger protein n=1 Tax=Caballeronia sp. LZ035 TaxID=3038568 RepID=UPI00285F0DD4|nr:ClpX C4-type zinc finger protein [Caballeronia sp. LZ035]MDR5756974.1 ClpX C4-type zinc finger protein [Caballeronia sp. LZ035]